MTNNCYLVMDNTGGHGMKEAITAYAQYLNDTYNITIVFQTSRSPYVNALGFLGFREVFKQSLE